MSKMNELYLLRSKIEKVEREVKIEMPQLVIDIFDDEVHGLLCRIDDVLEGNEEMRVLNDEIGALCYLIDNILDVYNPAENRILVEGKLLLEKLYKVLRSAFV